MLAFPANHCTLEAAKKSHATVAGYLLILSIALGAVGTVAADSKRASSVQPILGGVESVADAQPWMVALVRNTSSVGIPVRRLQFCGGTLINPDWVLTAAHCMLARSTTDMSVIIGETNIDEGMSGQEAISQIVVHPDYDANTFENDIALLKLASPSQLEPLELIDRVADASLASQNVRVFGWGQTFVGNDECKPEFSSDLENLSDFECKIYDFDPGSREFQATLLQADLRLISTVDCNARIADLLVFLEIVQSDQDNLGDFVLSSQICVYDPLEQKGVCFGDSGGPVTIEQEGKRVLVGTASLIYGSGGCARKLATDVFTRTASFLEFIDDVVHRDYRLSFEDFCPPAIIASVEYSDLDNGKSLVRIYWNPYDQATSYTLRYYSYEVPDSVIDAVQLDGMLNEIMAELSPGASFYASIQAENDFCSGPSSEVITVQVPNS